VPRPAGYPAAREDGHMPSVAGVEIVVEPDDLVGSAAATPSHDIARRALALLNPVLDASDVRSHCAHCGSDSHGALLVDVPRGQSPAYVSVTRIPGLIIAAATRRGPVGIDAETIERMSRAGSDDVALHPEERTTLAQLPPDDHDLARTVSWTRKEALLKATGHGLRVAPATVWLDGPDSPSDHSDRVVVLEAPPEVIAVIAGRRVVFTDVSADVRDGADDTVITLCLLEDS